MPDEPAAPATGTEGTPAAPTPGETPPAAEAPTPTPEPKPTETVDFWKQKAREQEKRAKDNAGAAKDLEKLRASMMSEQEKAVAEAEARGRQAATSEAGQRLAAAEIKAALTGVVPDPVSLIEDLNLAKYVGEDGEPDTDAIAELRKKFEALAPQADPQGAPPGHRPTEALGKVPLPNSDKIQLDDERDPRKLAARHGRNPF